MRGPPRYWMTSSEVARSMPTMSVTLRFRKGRGWYCRFFVDGRERERKVGGLDMPREEAEEKLAALRARNAKLERWKDPTPGAPLTVSDRTAAWLNLQGPMMSARTRATNCSLAKHLEREIGSRDLRALTDGDLRRLAGALLKRGLSGHTAAEVLSMLRRVCNVDHREGLIERPSLRFSEVIAETKHATDTEESTRDAWSHEEARVLLEAAQRVAPRFYPALLAAFHTGARRGELICLRWEDVNFETGRIHIRRASVLRGAGTKRPKSRRGRLIPLTPELAQTLREVRAHRVPPSDWVFASPRGKRWLERNFSRTWEKIRAHAALKGVRPLPFHCARHSFATWALTAGKSIKRVSEWTGDSVAVLEAHYAHIMPDDRTTMSFVVSPPNQLPGRDRAQPGRVRRAKRVTPRDRWHAGRDSNPRPSGSKA